VDAIVVHPDSIGNAELYRPLGRKLAIENMDSRKPAGQTAEDLDYFFGELPEAGLCFDVAHAKSVDPTMAEGARILDSFGDRLRHVHLSSLDDHCHHVPLTEHDESLFASLLSRCRDVPWILEAPTSS
jgi:sugar phosphate isomerase/epimerase